MNKFSILIIEDEKNICDFISKTLTSHGYRVNCATTGKEALSLASSLCPDIFLLDLGLPDMDGMEVIYQIRRWSGCPIIVVSARTQEADKVRALDAGADDYLTKPFGTSELMHAFALLCAIVTVSTMITACQCILIGQKISKLIFSNVPSP